MNKIICIIKETVQKYNSLSSAVKASVWFTICNFMQKGISMLTVPIFTRLMTTEQYGIYSVYQSCYSIITIFATLNLYSGVFNVGMAKYENDRNEFTLSLQNLCTFITGCLFVLYLVFQDYWNQLFGLDNIYIYAMFIELLFAPAFTFWSARERFEYKYHGLVLATLILAIGSPLIGIIAVLSSVHKAEARVLSFVFVQAVVGLLFYIYNSVRCKRAFSIKYWKYGLSFNLPLLPHYLSQIILGQADRVMINSMVGAAKAAIYSVAYNISSLMNLITNAINSSYIPFTYNALKKREYKKLATTTNIVLLMIAFGSIIVTSFGPEVIMIFAPKEYYEAIWVIPPVSASVYFMFLYPLFGNIEFYFEENKFVTLASIGGAIVNVILNWLAIPLWGYIAAAYTTLICYILYAFGHYIFMKFILKKHGVLEDVYNNKFIFLLSLSVIVLMIIMTLIYNNFVLRYLVVLVVLIIAVINRKNIVNTLLEVSKSK